MKFEERTRFKNEFKRKSNEFSRTNFGVSRRINDLMKEIKKNRDNRERLN